MLLFLMGLIIIIMKYLDDLHQEVDNLSYKIALLHQDDEKSRDSNRVNQAHICTEKCKKSMVMMYHWIPELDKHLPVKIEKTIHSDGSINTRIIYPERRHQNVSE